MDCRRVVEVAHLSHDQSVRASGLGLRSAGWPAILKSVFTLPTNVSIDNF